MRKTFDKVFAVVRVTICSILADQYIGQDGYDADTGKSLAAQVVNFLIGHDLEKLASMTVEPKKSLIRSLIPNVPKLANEAMMRYSDLPEVIIQSLRIDNVLSYAEHEKTYLTSSRKQGIENILSIYEYMVPDEPDIPKYYKIANMFYKNHKYLVIDPDKIGVVETDYSKFTV
jgi:hypothetical protein